MSGTAQMPGRESPRRIPASAVPELYQRSQAADLDFSKDEFAAVLDEVVDKYLASGTTEGAILKFVGSLHLEELALARACAAGRERAWEIFLTRYRRKLYDAARSITHEDSSARELADSLYAELYGTELRGEKRRSKLNYYTGHGSLEGWLRATLAQEYVNHYRRQQRTVSLDEKVEDGVQFAASDPGPQPLPDPMLAEATNIALAALQPEDRFILSSYYLDGRKLAEIGRMLGVHEATISRKLEKIARGVRKSIIDELLRRGMSQRQAEEALETDVRDVAIDVSGRLAQTDGVSAFYRKGQE
jgi:RNA polymerase sigma-70 factor (ECF subfamily)